MNHVLPLCLKLCVPLVFAGLMLAPGTGYAQTTDWTAAVDQDWNNPGNWTSGAPTATSTARLVPPDNQANINGAAQTQTLELQQGSQIVVGTGGSLAVGTVMRVGSTPAAGTASLIVDGGGTVTAPTVRVGDAAAGGQIIVSGAGSSLTIAPPSLAAADQFVVGNDGSGTLSIRSGSTVTVNGTGTLHVGRAAIGVLDIGGMGASGTLNANAVVLGNTGSFIQFTQTDTSTVSAAISGSGHVRILGTGATVLTGTNSYTGGTTVSPGGALRGTTNSLQGNIINNASVTFDQASNGTYAGDMSGTGTLVKEGSGSVILTGNNSYTGGTLVTAGTLRGSTSTLRGNITNNANLDFSQAGNGTYAGTISGTGPLVKSGTGTVTLTGTNPYSGSTTITDGILAVNGSLTNSTVRVFSGGTLGGTGTVRNTTVFGGGVLAPGNSIGTLTVNGNLAFQAGSTYRVEVDATGNNDRTNATGTLTISGGNVDVVASPGTYALTTRYTILNAAGGRSGTFSSVSANLAFLTPSLEYDPNNVYLTLARNEVPYNGLPGMTPNQQAASGAVQSATVGATGDMRAVLSAVNSLSVQQALSAFDAIGGASLVALRRAGPAFSAEFHKQLQSRAGNGQLARSEPECRDGSLASAAPAHSCGFWLRRTGSQQSTDTDGNAAANRLRNTGVSVGLDALVAEGLIAGGALTIGTSHTGFDSLDAGRSRTAGVALYAAYAEGPWQFHGAASMVVHSNHMDRSIALGLLRRIASSDFDSHTASVYGEVSYQLDLGGWSLQPLAGLAVSRNRTEGFTERGAGALNLAVAAQNVNTVKSWLGARASFELGRVRLEPRLVWERESGQINAPMTAQLQGAGTPYPFAISGVALGGNNWVLGLGAASRVGDTLDIFSDLQAEYKARQRNLALLVGLRSKW